jgi:hypothetical protein
VASNAPHRRKATRFAARGGAPLSPVTPAGSCDTAEQRMSDAALVFPPLMVPLDRVPVPRKHRMGRRGSYTPPKGMPQPVRGSPCQVLPYDPPAWYAGGPRSMARSERKWSGRVWVPGHGALVFVPGIRPRRRREFPGRYSGRSAAFIPIAKGTLKGLHAHRIVARGGRELGRHGVTPHGSALPMKVLRDQALEG